MPDVRLERFRCPNCGADFDAVLPDQQIITCRRLGCGAVFRVSQGLAFADVDVKRAQLISAHRKALAKALDAFQIKPILHYSSVILGLIPDDFRASIAQKLAIMKSPDSSDPRPLRNYLSSAPEATEEEFMEAFPYLLQYGGYTEIKLLEKLLSAYCSPKNRPQLEGRLKAQFIKLEQKNQDYADIPRDVFICHSSENFEVAEAVYQSLLADGKSAWSSVHNLEPHAMNYWADIERAIKKCKVFLVIASHDAMMSHDVQKEIAIARENDKPRVELKIDKYPHTSIFKDFFDGISWIKAEKNLDSSLDELNDRITQLIYQKHDKESEDILDDDEYRSLPSGLGKATRKIFVTLFTSAALLALLILALNLLEDMNVTNLNSVRSALGSIGHKLFGEERNADQLQAAVPSFTDAPLLLSVSTATPSATAVPLPMATAVPSETTFVTSAPTARPTPESKEISVSSSPEQIREMQIKLIALGWLSGEPTGSYDQATMQAVLAFQNYVNVSTNSQLLSITGVADENTQTMMNYSRFSKPSATAAPTLPPATTAAPTADPNDQTDLLTLLKEPEWVKVSVENVNVFARASQNSEVLGTIRKGDTFLCIAKNEYWVRLVSTAGDTAFTFAAVVEPIIEETPNEDIGSITPESDKERIRQLQSRLAELGWINGNQVDGIYGNITRQAVIKFQQRVNELEGPDTLTVTGIADASTLDYMLEDMYANPAAQPTATPAPTGTPTPTDTPTPTPRPTPTPTPRPTPTPTPRPTPTPTPRPTPTPTPAPPTVSEYLRRYSFNVTASSYRANNTPSADPYSMTDGRHETSWDSNGEKYAWFCFSTQSGMKCAVKGFRIINGKNDAEYFSKNCRIRQLELYVDGQYMGTYQMRDLRDQWQSISFGQEFVGSSFKFKITSVYDGTKYSDVCVAEFELY